MSKQAPCAQTLRERVNRTRHTQKGEVVRKVLEIGGCIAAVVLIGFGVGALVTGFNARSTVHDTLAQENIVGSPDMTPAAIKAEAKDAGLDVSTLSFPSMSVAGK